MNKRNARRAIPFVLAASVATHVAAAGPAATASMSSDCRPSSSGLHLYVINEASTSPQTLETAILETSGIWATAGLRLTWSFPPAPLDRTDNRTVVVMIQRGLKRPPALSAVPSKGPALVLLGQVPFGEDGPGNLIEVSFEAVASLVMGSSYLNKPVAKFPDLLQQVLLGRGLGRVLAHELGHWLVGGGHRQEGLMRPSFGGRDLVESSSPRLPRAWTLDKERDGQTTEASNEAHALARRAEQARWMHALRLTPGVAGAAFANRLPAFCGGRGTAIYVEGRPQDALGQRVCLVRAAPEFFSTMRIPLRAGRLLNESDTQGEPLTVVINEAAARTSWPGREPIGTSGRLGQPTAPGSTSSASSAM